MLLVRYFLGTCVVSLHANAQVCCGSVLDPAFVNALPVPPQSIQTIVTSPPYWQQRDYGHVDQLGHEPTPDAYVTRLRWVFANLQPFLRPTGTVWLNIGDKYHHGQLCGIPWMLATQLKEDGWYVRQDIIWHKPNARPESVKNRPSTDYEHLFLLTRDPQLYYYNADAIREPLSQFYRDAFAKYGTQDRPATDNFDKSKRVQSGRKAASTTQARLGFLNPLGRNKRSVWTIPARSFRGNHPAPFPDALVTPCILAGSRPGDIVCDPFCGTGTTAAVALKHGRNFLGCDVNPEYVAMTEALWQK